MHRVSLDLKGTHTSVASTCENDSSVNFTFRKEALWSGHDLECIKDSDKVRGDTCSQWRA